MRTLIIGVSILMTLALVATVGGLVYAFLKDSDREWS